MSTLIKHSDNVCVKGGRDSREYLSVVFRETDLPYVPYRVSLTRYCVPGRCDTYRFDFAHQESGPPNVRYFSDGWTPLPKAIKLLHEDLDKPQVVDLLVLACGKRDFRAESRVLIEDLLAVLAPKSKAYRACLKTYTAMEAKLRADFEANKTRTIYP